MRRDDGHIGAGGRGREVRRRQRGLLAVAVVAALAVALTGCDATQINDVLRGHADGATAHELNGADNGDSIDLGGGRYLIMYNDPTLGPVVNGIRGNSAFAGAALVVWDSNDNTIDTLLGQDGPYDAAYLRPADPDRLYWISNGIKSGNRIHLLLQEATTA